MCPFARYGDRAPKTIPARIFGIIWTLTGLVIISILIGAIASSLTTVTVEKEIMLYGTEVSYCESCPSRSGGRKLLVSPHSTSRCMTCWNEFSDGILAMLISPMPISRLAHLKSSSFIILTHLTPSWFVWRISTSGNFF